MKKGSSRTVTVRDVAEWCDKRGMTISEGLPAWFEEHGPIPKAPKGFTLAHGSEDRWIGDERLNRGWILTPIWDAATNQRTIDVVNRILEPGKVRVVIGPLHRASSDLVHARPYGCRELFVRGYLLRPEPR